MKKTYIFCLLLTLFSFGFSQTIVTIDRANIVGPTDTDNITSVSSIGITRGAGVNLSTTSPNFTANNWTIGGDQATAEASNDYIQWSVSASTSFDVAVDELDIRLRRNSSGPSTWQLFYSLDNFATAGIALNAPDAVPTSTSSFNLASLGISTGNSGTITFRLYAWGATGTGGWLRVREEAAWAGSLGIPFPGIRLIGSVSTATTNSLESDIIATSSFFSPTQNIDYTVYNATTGLTLFNSLPFGEFLIRDGGAIGTDSDTDGTILTDIQFTVANSENIAALAIFDGFTNIAEVTAVTPLTTFSGLNLVANDNATKQFFVFATFKSDVTDNEQVQLTINTASTPTTGSSLFADADAGGAETSIAGDDNRIEVTASQFQFNQQPIDTNQAEVMVPYPTISAVDINLNKDLDANITGISLTTSPSSSIVAQTYDMVVGEAVFNNIVFNDTETAVSLIANGSSLSGTSSTFDVNGPLISVIEQNFDSSTDWSYTSTIAPFGTVSDWGDTIGYFGEIALADAAPIDSPLFSNEIFGENDLNDFSNPFAILTFTDVDISSFNDVRVEFDWQVVGYTEVANDIDYRLFIDGIAQSFVSVFDGAGVASDDQGRVKIDIPDGTSTVRLQVRLRNNLATGYSGFDNFKIVSEFTGLIYTDLNGWKDNIVPDATTGALDALVIDGIYNLSGDVEVNNFLLKSGAQTIIPVSQSLTINGDLINDGDLELNSTSNTYSSIIVNGNAEGEITYNRHVNQFAETGAVTGNNDLIAAPVTSPSQDFLALRTANSVIPSGTIGGVPSFLFGPFDNNTNLFVNYNAANDSDLIQSGIGYRTASTTPGGSTFTFVGNVETNQAPVPITVGIASSFNLIGNPYPSYISLSGFLAENNAEFEIINSGVYGYDGLATDGYTVWNQAYSDANPSAVIAPGQGFLVASKTGGGSIDFPSSIRSIGTADDFIVGRSTNNLAHLKLKMTNENALYRTDLYFNDNASLDLDAGYDAAMYNNTTPSFAIYSHLVENNAGIDLAVQAVNYDAINDVIIPLGINANQGEQLTISIEDTDIPEGINVYLEDNATNTFTLLNDSDYVFTPNANLFGTGRFYLRVSANNVLSTSEEGFSAIQIYTTSTPKVLHINGELSGDTKAEIYDIQGRVVLSASLDNRSTRNQVDISNFNSGIYVVRLSNKLQQKTQKVIIK